MRLTFFSAKRETNMDGSSKTFQWSFKPLIWFFRFLGMEISSSAFLKYSALFPGALFVSLHLVINVTYLIFSSNQQQEHQTSDGGGIQARQINAIIDRINSVVYSSGVYIVFFGLILMVPDKWPELLRKMHGIEKNFDGLDVYEKCRKAVVAGIVLYLLVFSFLINI